MTANRISSLDYYLLIIISLINCNNSTTNNKIIILYLYIYIYIYIYMKMFINKNIINLLLQNECNIVIPSQ